MVIHVWIICHHISKLKSCLLQYSVLPTSLVTQYLRLCAPRAGAQAQSLVRELDPVCDQLRVLMLHLKIPRVLQVRSIELK